MIKIKKNFLLIVIIMFLLCSCNDTNSKQDESKVVSDNIVQEESIEEKFTVDEVVEYLCSEEVKDREYNKEGNQKTTEYINELYKQLNLEFVFGKSYLDNFFCDDINISNVVGKISGKDNSTAIILTAHFDAWFNGAVDNASGVATVLEIAKLLEDTSKKQSLNYDVIFLMTNGEMALFSGSRDFVTKLEKLQYQNVFNINIDCVGMKDSYNSNPLVLKNLSRVSESEKLYSGIKELIVRFEKNTLSSVKTRNLDDGFPGLKEIKNDQVRIIYRHIEGNKYVIIGIFQKKRDLDKRSLESMYKRPINNIKHSSEVENDLFKNMDENMHHGGRKNS